MPVTACQLRDLMALGFGAETIAIIVTIFERDATRDATHSVTLPSRSKGAERSARYRENIKQNRALAKANDVASARELAVTEARDATRDDVTEPYLSSLTLSQQGAVEGKKETKTVSVDRARKGTRLSPDWQPNDELRHFASEHGVDPDALRAEFVDYWIAIPGQRGCKTNWDSTFRNRVRAKQSYKKEKADGRRGNILPAMDRLNAKLAQFERADEPDMLSDIRGGAGQPPIRLLSSR